MTSVSDCRVSQVVNVKKGIHCLNPKNARDKEDMERPTKETPKYYVSHAKDADLNKAMNDASMGMINLLSIREEADPSRCLWARQCGDGLPGRRDLRYREERPLRYAEEHLGSQRRQALIEDEGRAAASRPFLYPVDTKSMALRFALIVALCCPDIAGNCAGSRPGGDDTTDLRSLTEAVGGDRVAAVSLVPPNMDAEDYQPKPQDVLRLKQARLLVRVGLDYDLWVDRLLVQAGQPEISRGGPAYVDASLAIAVLELRGMSVGPATATLMVAETRIIGWIRRTPRPSPPTFSKPWRGWIPANAAVYEANRQAFLARLNAKLAEWEAKLSALKSMPIVAYHNSWPYFARRFRLDFVGFIETKPGVPPSPSHLAGDRAGHARARRAHRRARAARAGTRRRFRGEQGRSTGRDAGCFGRRAAAGRRLHFAVRRERRGSDQRRQAMIDVIQFLWPPFLVAVCLVGIHAYFGILVLARKVIFVDLALAQIAALGATVAFMLGHPAQSVATYGYSLAFTLLAAVLLAFTRAGVRACRRRR